MNIRPLPYTEATGRVKDNYEKINEALGLNYLPLFFQYLGPFPEYLDYLTEQFIQNLQSNRFNVMIVEIGEVIYDLMKSGFSREHTRPVTRFRKEIDKIFYTNMRLVFLFIALREAVKGWAIAAKKLQPYTMPVQEVLNNEESFSPRVEGLIIFEDAKRYTDSTLQSHADVQIETGHLVEYMQEGRKDFNALLKKADYLMYRVEVEKIILRSLPLLPGMVFSPINVVLRYIAKYENYTDLLYLLSDQFPQLSVQRLLFSAYLR